MFNLTYSKANFYIEGPFSGGIYEYKKQTVILRSFEATEKTLKLFGDLVQFIQILFSNIDEMDIKEIIGFINNNCTESLTKFHLKNCDRIVLNEFKKPFPHVKKATFLSVSKNKSQIDIKLNQIFPHVQSLELKIVDFDDWELIGDKFLDLKMLTVELPEPNDSYYPDIGGLFKESRNINSIVINYISLKMLSVASEFLLNLKTLSIVTDILDEPYDGDKIHFSNVTHLVLNYKDNKSKIPEKMVFTELHELDLRINSDFTDEWIEFFKNQQNKIIYKCQLSFRTMTSQQLIAIADSQPNIIMAYIRNTKDLSVDAIIKFLEKCKQLVFLNLKEVLINVAERKILQEKLSSNWGINGGRYITLGI